MDLTKWKEAMEKILAKKDLDIRPMLNNDFSNFYPYWFSWYTEELEKIIYNISRYWKYYDSMNEEDLNLYKTINEEVVIFINWEWKEYFIDFLKKFKNKVEEIKKEQSKKEVKEEPKKDEVIKWNSWSIEEYKVFSDVEYKNFSEVDVNFYNFVWYKITEFTNFFYIFAFFVIFILSYNLIKSILWK